MRLFILGFREIWAPFLIVCAWTGAAISFHLKLIPVDVLGTNQADLVKEFGYNFVGGYVGVLIAFISLVSCCLMAIVVGGRQPHGKP